MNPRAPALIAAAAALLALCGGAAYAATAAPGDTIIPGASTKAEIVAALGQPWRVTQFDDCGEPMPGEANEIWEYRGHDASGFYRLHIEFDGRAIVHLIARLPDRTPGGQPIPARTEPECPAPSM